MMSKEENCPHTSSHALPEPESPANEAAAMTARLQSLLGRMLRH